MHQPTLVKWADLLGPIFPSDAAVDLRPQLSQISIRWTARADDAPLTERVVEIFIAPAAIKDYRNAQDGKQARADRKLFALVHANLKSARIPESPAPPDSGVRIVVASVDIL